jgi:hypothetical protein
VNMQTRKFVLQAGIDSGELDKWVAAGWLMPRQNGTKQDYSDVDLARAHLIRDLLDLGVNGGYPDRSRSCRPAPRIAAHSAGASDAAGGAPPHMIPIQTARVIAAVPVIVVKAEPPHPIGGFHVPRRQSQ